MSAALIRGPAIGPFIRELHAAQLAASSRWDELCPPAEHRALVLRLRAWPRDEAAHHAFLGLRAAYQATPEFRAWAPLREQLARAIAAPLRGSVYRGAPDFESALILLAAPERAMGLCYTRRWLLDRFKRRPLPDDVVAALRALAFAAMKLWDPRVTIERSAPGERYPDTGEAAIYLCSDVACSAPMTDPARVVETAEAFLAN